MRALLLLLLLFPVTATAQAPDKSRFTLDVRGYSLVLNGPAHVEPWNGIYSDQVNPLWIPRLDVGLYARIGPALQLGIGMDRVVEALRDEPMACAGQCTPWTKKTTFQMYLAALSTRWQQPVDPQVSVYAEAGIGVALLEATHRRNETRYATDYLRRIVAPLEAGVMLWVFNGRSLRTGFLISGKGVIGLDRKTTLPIGAHRRLAQPMFLDLSVGLAIAW